METPRAAFLAPYLARQSYHNPKMSDRVMIRSTTVVTRPIDDATWRGAVVLTIRGCNQRQNHSIISVRISSV
jgi:hypothetical protein